MAWPLAQVALTFSLLGAELDSASLRSYARLSPRPIECSSTSLEQDRWRRALGPALEEYCGLLGRGYALLQLPEAALALAERARGLRPADAAPELLAARANVSLGKHAAAWRSFNAAEEKRGFTLSGPEALHDYARAAIMNGAAEAARAAYRRVVPLGGLIENQRRALELYVEAALSALSAGPDGLTEASAYLVEAERRNDSTQFPELVALLAAIVSERSGNTERSKILALHSDPIALEVELTPTGRYRPPVIDPIDAELLRAVAYERTDPARAREAWVKISTHYEQTQSPWLASARRKLGAKK